MMHSQIRAVYKHPKTKRVIGYGKPRSMPPDMAQHYLDKYAGEWELVSDQIVVENKPKGSYTPATGIAELTEDGKKYLAELGLAGPVLDNDAPGVAAPGVKIKTDGFEVEGKSAPMSLSDARKTAKVGV